MQGSHNDFQLSFQATLVSMFLRHLSIPVHTYFKVLKKSAAHKSKIKLNFGAHMR